MLGGKPDLEDAVFSGPVCESPVDCSGVCYCIRSVGNSQAAFRKPNPSPHLDPRALRAPHDISSPWIRSNPAAKRLAPETRTEVGNADSEINFATDH